jgi:hypothetical protein
MKITSRLLATVQSKGNLGKSTECLARIEWLNRHNIEWQAYDLDDAHRSIVKRHPAQTNLLTIAGPESAEQLLRVFREAGHAPVQIMDSRAQATEEILQMMTRTKFLSVAAEQGVRATVFLFPFDDLATMENLQTIVQGFGNEVDYVIVRNPAKNSTRMYDGSGLQTVLKQWGAVEIIIPALFKSTLLTLDRLEGCQKRGIPWSEAIKNKDLKIDVYARGDLECFLIDLFYQYDLIAGHLLPTDAAAKIPPPKPRPTGPKYPVQVPLNFGNE